MNTIQLMFAKFQNKLDIIIDDNEHMIKIKDRMQNMLLKYYVVLFPKTTRRHVHTNKK